MLLRKEISIFADILFFFFQIFLSKAKQCCGVPSTTPAIILSMCKTGLDSPTVQGGGNRGNIRK